MLDYKPSMATLGNLTGKLLCQADLARTDACIDDYRITVRNIAQKILNESEAALADAATNLTKVIGSATRILTHSYSSTVKRALELVSNSGRRPVVYVTRSNPGNEGEALAYDLKKVNLQTEVVQERVINSVMSNVDLVVLGADSVLSNGSVINKIGTRAIAIEAKSRNIMTYVACETNKFSTASFLGEQIEISDIFDVTPNTLVSKFVTEGGFVEPEEVEERIKVMLRELYT